MSKVERDIENLQLTSEEAAEPSPEPLDQLSLLKQKLTRDLEEPMLLQTDRAPEDTEDLMLSSDLDQESLVATY